MTVQTPDLENTLNERNDLDDKKIYLDEIGRLEQEQQAMLEDIASYAGCRATVADIKSVISTGLNAIELIDEAQRVVEDQANSQNAKVSEYVIYLKNMEKKLERDKSNLLSEIDEANLAIKRLKDSFLLLQANNKHHKKMDKVLSRLGKKGGYIQNASFKARLAVFITVFLSVSVVGTIVGVTFINLLFR